MEGLLIGYAEYLKFFKPSVGTNVEIRVEGFVEDLMLAIYELRLIGSTLFVFKRNGNNWNDKSIYLVCTNFVIYEGRVS